MSESQILPHPDGCRVVAFSRHGGTPDTIEIETPRGTLTKSMGKDFMNLSAERVKVGGTHRRVYQLYAEALLRTGRVGAVAVARNGRYSDLAESNIAWVTVKDSQRLYRLRILHNNEYWPEGWHHFKHPSEARQQLSEVRVAAKPKPEKMQMPAGKYGQMAIKPQDWTSHREVRDAEKFQAELSKRTKQSHETFEPEIIDPFEQEQQQ